MAQKIFEPLRKIPHQIQNFGFIQKIHDFAAGRVEESFGNCQSSAYGCVDSPTALAFDNVLGLVAIGTKNGQIKIYGTPGVSFTISHNASSIIALEFCPNEGRIVSIHADGFIDLHELNAKSGSWIRRSHVFVINPDCENLTCMAIGEKVVYVGSSLGTLRQVARDGSQLSLGDDSLTACTPSMVVETVPLDKREEVHVDSPIVSLAMQPEGNHLLVAYASGCVAVAIPQPLVDTTAVEPRAADVAPTAEVEPTTPNTEENPVEAAAPPAPTEASAEAQPAPAATEPTSSPVTGTPVKEGGERRATLKLKGLARTLRGTDTAKAEAEPEHKLPVPPAPRISHLLIRDQPVESAAWRVTAVGGLSTEVIIAYGDGAFQVWPVVAAVSQQPQEPIIVSKREPPSTPYGPLPCGAIKKIIVNPGEHGGMLTAFSGGLPRPEFQDRHAVTVMQGQEHHVCFQFGSEVKDFLFIPKKGALGEAFTTESDINPSRSFAVAALLVLTERELLAVDLMRPEWPVVQLPYLSCLSFSPVTAIAHLSQVPYSLLQQSLCCDSDIIWGGSEESSRETPVNKDHCDVAILGHASGLISMFALGKGDCVYRVGVLHTASMFIVDGESSSPKCMEEETWPPFRRVGYCSLLTGMCAAQLDPRLAVTRIEAFMDDAGAINLVVGGAGGHVSLWAASPDATSVNPSPVAFEPDVARIHANLIDPQASVPKYQWKGPSALRPFEGVTQLCDSIGVAFAPRALIQLDPPAPITAVACERSWNLLAIGSVHGFAVIDLLAKSAIHTQLLYDRPLQQKITHTVSSVQREIVNRGKQITASMRQSFRRFKQLRSGSTSGGKSTEAAPEAAETEKKPEEGAEQTAETKEEAPIAVAETEKPPAEGTSEPEKPAEEEQKEAGAQPTQKTEESDEAAAAVEDVETITLTAEENLASVRSLLFADTYLLSAHQAGADAQQTAAQRTPSLWVGTANGRAIAHMLKWDGTQGPVKVQLLKELQLRHQAPVIGMCVIDAATRGPVSQTPRKRVSCEPLVIEESAPAEKPTPEEAPAETEPPATSGDTKPAADAPAAPPADVHQLLVCSEEQVKLFSLPALRALHKHKFVDRIRLPYGVGHITLTSDTKSEKPATEATTEPGEATEEESKAQSSQQIHRKALTAFGVQFFTRDASDPSKGAWYVVAVRRDCKGSILSLSHLRQICKLRKCVDASAHPLHCISSLSGTNLILWYIGSQMFAQELSAMPQLLSPFTCAPGHKLPQFTMTLPEWVRPGDTAQPEHAVEEVQATAPEVQPAVEAVEEQLTEVVEPLIEPEVKVTDKPSEKDPEAKVCQEASAGAPQAGDLTIDSIKEYLNGDDTVTVKTFESSTEKHTLVEGGRIVTTLHETEKVDGKIVKDDVVKFTSDGEGTTPMVTDSN